MVAIDFTALSMSPPLLPAASTFLSLLDFFYLADLGLPPNFRSASAMTTQPSSRPWRHPMVVPLSLSPGTHNLLDLYAAQMYLTPVKGLNLKRYHETYRLKFNEVPDICPYSVTDEELDKKSMEAEKRACAVVREVLGMTVEKRTLIDHLTHFRKDFGLSNKLRSMIIRHPELFYVSVKGPQRDSVFLVEGFDDKGELLEKDESCVIKAQLMGLVREGKKLRRLKRRGVEVNNGASCSFSAAALNCEHEIDDDDEDSDMELVFGDSEISESEEQQYVCEK